MHLKSTFGFCADIVWNILSPDSKSSTHSIHVWYIYIYMYHKKSTRCREIDQSHGSYGVWFRVDYLPSLCCFRSFFVSQITKTSEMLKVGDTGGSMGKPRCPLQGRNGLHQKMNPRKGLYRLKATWDIIWIICISNKYKLIYSIYVYICISFFYLHKYKYIFTYMASSLNSTKPRFLFLWHNPNFNGLKLGSWKWWEIVRIPFFQSLQVNFV